MGFAAGLVATQLSKTGIVAAVCETSGIDSMWRYCEGFRAGVEFADGTMRTLVIYRDDGDREKLFLDEAWGYETGSDLIRRGADVVFAAGGVTGQGALRAALEFGAYAIGAERDQAAVLGETRPGLVTSFYGDARFEVQETMRLVKNGGISGGRVGKIRFSSLHPSVDPSSMSDLEALIALLSKGEIVPNVTKEKP
jgi:basic membrane protein A